MRIDAAGRLVSFRATGKSTFGSPIDESFEYANGVARWKSRADDGERAGELSAQYVPVENSFETVAVIARTLLRQPVESLRHCRPVSCRFVRCGRPPCSPDRAKRR